MTGVFSPVCALLMFRLLSPMFLRLLSGRLLMGGLFVLSMLLILSQPASATVYRRLDERGQVHWSDRPGGLPTPPPTPVVMDPYAPADPVTPPAASFRRCDQLQLTLPAPETPVTATEAATGIALRLICTPQLAEGARVQLRVNGRINQSALHTHAFLLSGLTPGTYRLRAELVDADGRVRQQSPVLSIRVGGAAPDAQR